MPLDTVYGVIGVKREVQQCAALHSDSVAGVTRLSGDCAHFAPVRVNAKLLGLNMSLSNLGHRVK